MQSLLTTLKKINPEILVDKYNKIKQTFDALSQTTMQNFYLNFLYAILNENYLVHYHLKYLHFLNVFVFVLKLEAMMTRMKMILKTVVVVVV